MVQLEAKFGRELKRSRSSGAKSTLGGTRQADVRRVCDSAYARKPETRVSGVSAVGDEIRTIQQIKDLRLKSKLESIVDRNCLAEAQIRVTCVQRERTKWPSNWPDGGIIEGRSIGIDQLKQSRLRSTSSVVSRNARWPDRRGAIQIGRSLGDVIGKRSVEGADQRNLPAFAKEGRQTARIENAAEDEAMPLIGLRRSVVRSEVEGIRENAVSSTGWVIVVVICL